jgi:hypothetical protein
MELANLINRRTMSFEALQLTPAGLSLPVLAQHVRSRSTHRPGNESRAIERAALSTVTGSPAYS